MIEQLQRRGTKFILNDYKSDYYNHLLRLNLLHIMYTFELTDMFAIKSLKAPSSNFDMTKYSSFYCWTDLLYAWLDVQLKESSNM